MQRTWTTKEHSSQNESTWPFQAWPPERDGNDFDSVAQLSIVADRNKSQCKPRSALKGARGQVMQNRVRFLVPVQVISLGEDRSGQFWTSTSDVHQVCRYLWHLQGQVVSHDQFFHVIHSWEHISPTPQTWGGIAGKHLAQCQQCISARRPAGSLTRDCLISTAIAIHAQPAWQELFEIMMVPTHRQRLYIEVWFLDPIRAPICLRARRIRVPRDMPSDQITDMCLHAWADFLVLGARVQLTHVMPTPSTYPATVAHVIITQDFRGDHTSILMRSDAFPVLQKHRAVSVANSASVADIMRAAHHQVACDTPFIDCAIRDLARPPLVYHDSEIPQLAQGSLVTGTATAMYDSSDDEQEAASDSDDASDATTGTPSESSSSATSADLDWHEMPMEFCLQDVFDDGPSYTWLTSQNLTNTTEAFGDFVSLMQRDRSRSRNQTHSAEDELEAEDPNAENSGDEQEESEPASASDRSEPDTFSWQIIYTDMPIEPVNVLAPEGGPTLEQARQATGFPLHSVVGLYPVRSLIEQQADYIAIMECREDYIGHGSEVLILFSIMCRDQAAEQAEAEPGEYGPHLFNSAHIARTWQAFDTFAVTFRLSHFIATHPGLVSVYHNGDLWRHTDRNLHRFRNGDHVEVVFQHPVTHAARVDLIDWLLREGLTVWPSLLESSNYMVVSPTLPFDITEEPASSSCGRPSQPSPRLGYHTWYISHRRHIECHESRVVVMDHNPLSWKSALSQVWQDVFDPDGPYTVTWISPPPIASPAESRQPLPHLMIEQHIRPGMIAVHLTSVMQQGETTDYQQGAFSTASMTRTHQYLGFMKIDGLCTHRFTCHVMHDQLPVRDSELVNRPTGQALTIYGSLRPQRVMQTDASSMMQLDVHPVGHSPPADTGATDSDPPSLPALECMTPHPGSQVAMEAQPADSSIADAIDRVMSMHDVPSQQVLFSTYYLSPVRLQHCAFPRFVQGPTSMLLLRETLIRAWQDLVDPNSPLELILVYPQPPTNEHARHVGVIFIILAQHRQEAHRPALVTLEEASEFLRVATLFAPVATIRQVVRSVGQQQRCLGAHGTASCAMHIHDLVALPSTVFEVSPGLGIRLQIQELPDHSAQWNPGHHEETRNEGFSLLQTGVARLCHQAHTEDNVGLRSGLDAQTMPREMTELTPPLPSAHQGQEFDLSPPSPATTLHSLKHALGRLTHRSLCKFNTDWTALPELHPAAQHAVDCTPNTVGHVPHEIHVYTDGSARDGNLSWALVALDVTYSDAGMCVSKRGFAGGRVDCTLGNFAPHALDAEATAVIGLAEIMLGQPSLEACPIVCHCDSTAAGLGAFGEQALATIHGQEAPRQMLARVLVHLLQQGRRVTLRHVHAHEFHPWNEFADSVAYAIRERWEPPIAHFHSSAELACNPLYKWAWTLLSPTPHMPSLETIVANAPPGDFQAWASGLQRLYQSIHRVGPEAGNHFSMLQLAIDMQEPLPMEQLHIQKMRLAAQLLQAHDEFMFYALIANHRLAGQDSWISSLQRSVQWLMEQTGSESLPPQLATMDAVEHWMELQSFARPFKKRIQAAARAHLLRMQSLAALQEQSLFQDQLLTDMLWTCPSGPPETPLDFQCPDCPATFASEASLAVHQSKKNGSRIAMRRFATNGACCICHRWYHTRPRAILHLQSSSTDCWLRALRTFQPLSQEAAMALDQHDCQAHTAHHQRGLRTAEQDRVWRPASSDEIAAIGLQPLDQPVTGDTDPSAEELTQWAHIGLLPPGRGGRNRTQRKLDYNVMSVLRNYEASRLELLPHWRPCHDWVPRPLALGEKFIMVLFSGHRRDGDIGTWVHRLSNLTPICIDLAVHEEAGNVLQDSKWIDLIRTGRVLAGHAGPPCETYTLARWLALDDTNAPRPLRTATHPGACPGEASARSDTYDLSWRPSYYLGGRTQSGAWRTTEAKAYPSTLCRVLAAEYISFAAHQPYADGADIPEAAQAAIQKLCNWDPYMLDAAAGHMAMDYHPEAFG
eukprot:Skav207265  [mRNA]  locus=scaffold434:14169:23378:- [translate_table: standard]